MTLPREIKFRAWHKGHEYAPAQMIYDKNPGDCLVWKLQGQNIEEIMQYTGLKDRNGVEIYEGDQLFAPGNLSDDLEYIGDVVWDENDARWEVHSFLGTYEYVPDRECVVKGNIYESKEESQ